ncbi:DUF402 domain-containing protein [Nocardioides campestrisoli]|uniref:DUF402 domain-containing protein n=1 Tax=Nocardioides campestrisoli TaxID=2736757 RepID=UPI00163DA1A2|nr:DUF402 domain-containing protein [Nocardioides campestrisoli]
MRPGQPVRCEITKWGDRPHWSYEGVWLGADEHGEWLGFPVGTLFARPGHRFVTAHDQVGLVPAAVDGTRPWWLATLHGEGAGTLPPLAGEPVALYVDMTTPARWDGTTLRAVDLDLDVVGDVHGRVVVDDEDEFAEHQVLLGYPAEVVAAARASCAQVLAAASAGDPPYDGTHRRWLAELARISASNEP